MAIISSYIFWIIISAIIIVLALIGYLAEGTEFANKALKKQKNDVAKTDTGVVEADLPVEVLKVKDDPSAWTGDVPAVDERQETEHKVDSVDDWMNTPNVNEIPKISKEEVQKAMDNSDSLASSQNSESEEDDINSKDIVTSNQDIFDDSQEMFPDIKPEDLEPIDSVPEGNQDTDTDTVWK